MTLFAAKILSLGAWAGKRRVASIERERPGPDESDGIEAGCHSNRRASCSSDNREPASLSSARKTTHSGHVDPLGVRGMPAKPNHKRSGEPWIPLLKGRTWFLAP
jgi:hypothetical protein